MALKSLICISVTVQLILAAIQDTANTLHTAQNERKSPLTQGDLDEIGNSLEIQVKVVDNLEFDGGKHLFNVTLYNSGINIIPGYDWTIYFYSFFMIESDHLPKDGGVILDSQKIRLNHVQGCLFSLEPVSGFGDIGRKETKSLRFFGQNWAVSKSDIPPNWYIDAPNLQPRLLNSTWLGNPNFVADFSLPKQWKRYKNDLYNPFTPENRFERYKIDDLGKPGKLIIPTPKEIQIDESSHLRLDSATWRIRADTAFKKEAQFLAGKANVPFEGSNTSNISVKIISLIKNTTMDREEYDLNIDPGADLIIIKGGTSAGVFYGVQSLLSLLDGSTDRKLPKTELKDKPRFEYRGMHIDVARNFHGKDDIIRLIDAMAMYKMNKLHFHLTDDEGWRVEISGLPDLTDIGSNRCHDKREDTCLLPQLGSGPYNSSSGSGYFTRNEYIDIIKYSNERHIEVIPEVDMPGHARAAIKAMEARYKRLTTEGQVAANRYRLIDPNDSSDYLSTQMFNDNSVNPCVESTYNFISKVIQELMSMHKTAGQPLNKYHFGGDEVANGAWQHSPACNAINGTNSGLIGREMYKQYFVQRVANITHGKGLSLVAWEDGLMDEDKNPYGRHLLANNDIIANAWDNVWEWGSAKRAYALANQNYKVVLSHATHLYFDHPYEPDPDERGLYWAPRYTDTFKAFGYNADDLYKNIDTRRSGAPITLGEVCQQDNSGCPPLNKSENIIGMQGHLWSETVLTKQHFDYMIFPRILTIAERAWHKASWELVKDKALRETELLQDWQLFANTIGYKELNRLKRIGIDYRIPPPGAILKDGKLVVNTEFPSLKVEYSDNKGGLWRPIPVNFEPKDNILLRAKSADGLRSSREILFKLRHSIARFVNGSMPFEGRIELYHDGIWRPLYSTLSANGASVMCKTMGYNATDIVSREYPSTTFGTTEGTLNWISDYNCSGDENDIEECIANNQSSWSTTTRYNAQGASCYLNARLVNGPSRMIGRLELFRNNQWGTVCGINFTNKHATAICRMLAGAHQARHVTAHILKSNFLGKGTGPSWKFKYGCGTNGDIVRCLQPESFYSDCSHDDDVSLFCKSNMSLRLTGGSSEFEGTVELEKNGTWGELCDTGFNRLDAIATCRTLGFWVNSPIIRGNSYFGQSSLPKWQGYPDCSSNDFDITMCAMKYPYLPVSCSTSGIQCQPTSLGRNNIRLKDGNGTWNGMIEVKLNNNWGGICWNDWDKNITDIVCRMLRFRGNDYSSFPMDRMDTALFLHNLNCTGNEDDIGLCKASTNIEGCTDKAVGIDCSGGFEVRLVGGNNSFEGRVEIKRDGTWGTLCDSSWDVNDAKVICSMMGFSVTSPTIYNNAHFGQGTGSMKYTDLGCSGWENHIGQCDSIPGGSCSHSDDAGVKCFSCVKEYDTETGTLMSPNYPNNYDSYTDCVYIIKPNQTEAMYTLTFADFYLGCCTDYVEIREGQSGRHLAKFADSYKPHAIIPGKDFVIHFKSDSRKHKGFQLTWKPLTLRDTIVTGCGSATWQTAINITLLRFLYPDSNPELIFMNNRTCKGIKKDDLLVFEQNYSECGSTQQKTVDAGIRFQNTIMYPEASGGSFPIIIRHFRWKMDIECHLHKTASGNQHFKPDEATSTTDLPNSGQHNVDNSHGLISGSGHHSVSVNFYQDQGFFEELTGNPLVLHIGETVYVKVSTAITNQKMRLHTCTTKPYESASVEYLLIKDGCIIDTTTHILSQTNQETKFVFTAFEFPTYQSNVYVKCNATFCNTTETPDECNQRCHHKRHASMSQVIYETKSGISQPFVVTGSNNRHSHPGKRSKRNAAIVSFDNSPIIIAGIAGIALAFVTAVVVVMRKN